MCPEKSMLSERFAFGFKKDLFGDAFAYSKQRKSYRDFYILEILLTKAELFRRPDDRQLCGVGPNKFSAQQLAADRIRRTDYPTQRSWASSYWSWSVHRDNAVDDGQSGIHIFINLYQQRAEVVLIFAFGEVPECFLFAADTAEHVFDRKCRSQLS